MSHQGRHNTPELGESHTGSSPNKHQPVRLLETRCSCCLCLCKSRWCFWIPSLCAWGALIENGIFFSLFSFLFLHSSLKGWRMYDLIWKPPKSLQNSVSKFPHSTAQAASAAEIFGKEARNVTSVWSECGRGTLHPCSVTHKDHRSLKLCLALPSYNCGWKYRLQTSRTRKLFKRLSIQHGTASEQVFSRQDGTVKFSGFLQAWKERDLLHRSS